MSKLSAALALADLGFYVFPLIENGKTPALSGDWKKHSTVKHEKIKKLWIDPVTGWERDYNIAIDCGKSGLCVIDIDVKEGKQGQKSYEMLDMLHGFPATLTATTASGGKHLFYKAEGLGNTASKIGKDIDSRGAGGYVAAVGSTISDKPYSWVDSLPRHPAPLPDWLTRKIVTANVSAPAKKQSTFSEDKEEDIKRAILWLEEAAELAVQGAGGDHTTFQIACHVKDFGVSEETCLNLMLDHWNERCSPPWLAEDLEVKVGNAYRYGQNAVGRASAQADFDIVLPDADVEDWAEMVMPLSPSDVPPRQWVFGNVALAKKLSALVAPGGAGKSTLTITIALSKVTGRDLLGVNPLGRAPVWIWNNEDDKDEMNRRMLAIMQQHGISFDELFDNDARGDAAKGLLFMTSGEKHMLKIAQRTDKGTLKPLQADKIIAIIKKHGIKLWIVDPFAESHPAGENSNEEILDVMKIYRYIAQEADCAIILVHHDRKPENASAEGHAGNMYSARGASSFVGAVRVLMTLHTMSEKDAKAYGIAIEDRKRYVRWDFGKANLSFERDEPRWYQRLGVRIGAALHDPDGESVGVLVPAKLVPRIMQPTDGQAMLIQDVEAMVDFAGDAGMAVSEVSTLLVQNFPMHNGKDSVSLSKAIRRLFDEKGVVETGKGKLHLFEGKNEKNRMRFMIRWEPVK